METARALPGRLADGQIPPKGSKRHGSRSSCPEDAGLFDQHPGSGPAPRSDRPLGPRRGFRPGFRRGSPGRVPSDLGLTASDPASRRAEGGGGP